MNGSLEVLDIPQAAGVAVASLRPDARECATEDLRAWLSEPAFRADLAATLAQIWSATGTAFSAQVGPDGDTADAATIAHDWSVTVAALAATCPGNACGEFANAFGLERFDLIRNALIEIAHEHDETVTQRLDRLVGRVAQRADLELHGEGVL